MGDLATLAFISLAGEGCGGDLLAGGEGRLPQTPPHTPAHHTWVSEGVSPEPGTLLFLSLLFVTFLIVKVLSA
jgi:hypothetical protein